jgi:hypothetical protein
MGKKKHKGLVSGVAAKAIHHPVVQKAIADIAVAAVLAIAAKLSESKAVARLGRRAGRKLDKAARATKSEQTKGSRASRRRTA